MTTTFPAIPHSGVPFPKAEYDRRQQRVLAAMERAGLDALLVTAHGHARYLTGYDGRGAYFAPFPLILVPGRAPTYVVREYEEYAVRAYSCIEDVVLYTQEGDFPKVCADVLHAYGLQDSKVGLELGCWNLAPADVTALQAQLPNMEVVDATRLVASVAAVKSELELQAMREAIASTDLAVQTFQGALREGVTEIEVYGAILKALGEAGRETRPFPTLVFGGRTTVAHGGPLANPLRNNEPAMIEIGGAKDGYAAGLVRSALLGTHAESEELHALAVEALDTAIAAIQAGVTAGEIDSAARKVVERAGRSSAFRHRAGYQSGMHWLERGNLSLEPGATEIIEAGMTLHLPIILFGEGILIGTSQHVVVKERGAEILSSTPHTLHRI